jgi:signal transduction histidine kinase/ligand-binding sensor domain-containing protein
MACLLLAVPVGAADPERRPEPKITGYKHTGWTPENGAPAAIRDLAQSADGYLWIAAADGLFRFDGMTFERMPALRDPELGEFQPQVVHASSSGDVWIGYGQAGIARYRHGELHSMNMPNAPEYVVGIADDGNGGLWVLNGRDEASLTHFSGGKWQEMGRAQGIPLGQVRSVFVDRRGTTWAFVSRRLLFLRRGATRFETTPEQIGPAAQIAEDPRGRIWLVDRSGVRQVPDYPHRPPMPAPPVTETEGGAIRTMIFDRNGDLWGTDRTDGLSRIRAVQLEDPEHAKGEFYRAADGLTSDRARPVLQDREGNIWVGTEAGLDRFRPAVVRLQEGIPPASPTGYGAVRDASGVIYVVAESGIFAISGNGPARRIAGVGELYSGPCLRRDGSAVAWIPGTFLALSPEGVRPSTTISESIYDCGEDRYGRLWIDSMRTGPLWGDAAGWHPLAGPPEQDLLDGVTIAPSGMAVAKLGSRYLMRLDPQRPILLPAARLGVGAIVSVNAGQRDLLVSGARGLARLRNGMVRVIDGSRYPWLTRLRGLGQSSAGDSWMLSPAGIVRVATRDLDRAFEQPGSPLPYDLFDQADGVTGASQKYGYAGGQVFEGRDGGMRFLTSAGVMVIHPSAITRNTVPPPVVVSALISRGTKYLDPSNLMLRAGTSSIQIAYSALSLSVPERVRFRYKLEGVDEEWMDPGMRRQAFYSNLGPGTYRFRVIAANNDGVWNRAGATLEFTIPPTFLQSVWFKLLCALVVGVVLWIAYSIHVRRVTARLQSGLEVRLAERERIARELHDTLLQGFQGLMLRFQSVADRIPPGEPLRNVVDEALDRADAVLIEGRDRVRELRTAAGGDDLAQALMAAAGEITMDPPVRFDLTIEGSPRPMHPIVCEEIQRIGEEAIRNAFQHAQASKVLGTIAYHAHQLRFDIRDDGIGLPADVAAAGERPGHFGLTGMRERAARIGGILTIVSREGAGTEILLSIPGRAAYVAKRSRWRLPRLRAGKPRG